MHRGPRSAEPLERGLYTDRATGPHGETAMHLVDRRGNVIVRVQVARPGDVQAARYALARLLTELDPAEPTRPRLELIDGGAL